MVVRAAMLVIGDEEQSLLPCRRLTYGLPDRPEELLSGDHVVGRMLVVRLVDKTGLEE